MSTRAGCTFQQKSSSPDFLTEISSYLLPLEQRLSSFGRVWLRESIHPTTKMLYIIVLGLCDEKDITMRRLEVLSLISCLFHIASRSPHLLAGEQNFVACLPRAVHQHIDGEQGTFRMSVISVGRTCVIYFGHCSN